MSRTIKKLMLKQHDLAPPYYGKAVNSAGLPVDLSGATVLATMKPKVGGSAIFTRQACTITNAATGLFLYQWQAGNTDTVGEFVIEFEFAPAASGKFTLPADRIAEVEITADLDGV